MENQMKYSKGSPKTGGVNMRVNAIVFLSIGLFTILMSPGLLEGQISSVERIALIALYDTTTGDNWSDNSGWKTPPLDVDGFAMPGTENTWFGVTCDSGNTTVQEIRLTNNNLVGSIPTELGNLTNLQILLLNTDLSISPDRNYLSGNIPTQLGNLLNLQVLKFTNNQLDGQIPTQLGNLSSLQTLWLSKNQLTGNIPTELADISNLRDLRLNKNQLGGGIPTQLGTLSNLQILYLSRNELSGEIPSNFTSLTTLSDNASDFRWNAIYTTDNTVRTFLNTKQAGGDWESTQTIAPGGVSAGSLTDTSIRVSWTPIVYTGAAGSYRVFFSTVPGGAYTLFGITADKTVSQMDVTGLSPGTTYYFVVQTRTNSHPGNDNTIDSEYSSEVSATTLTTPTVITDIPTGITATTVTLWGMVSADGGAAVTARGMCWGTSIDPTLAGNYNTEGPGLGSFVSTISGLTPATTYYIRAYAANSVGTAYGANRTVTTGNAIPQSQRDALIALYNSTNGDSWTINLNWKAAPLAADGFALRGTENTWFGIACNASNTTVTGIQIAGNNLNGPLPAQLGDLPDLSELSIYYNPLLTGGIPVELGSLSNLQTLQLTMNQLDGTIPVELGDLSDLTIFSLDGNRLEGALPTQLGNLVNLQYIGLSANALTGEIPAGFILFTDLVDDGSEFRYNGLYTGDNTLRAFLNAKQNGGDWESYQTVAPGGVSVGPITYTSIRVSWVPISYTADSGSYGVYYGTAPGGPYTLYGTTADKTVSQMDIAGLTPGTTYYFVVQTRTDSHGNNNNTLNSEDSAEVTASTLLTPPIVTTTEVSAITRDTAVSGGQITANGGAPVTGRGICWSTSENPTTSDNPIAADISSLTFTCPITGLTPGTVYHVRAYAGNSAGTGYGNDVSFTTTAAGVPVLTTAAITGITRTTAVSGGNVIENGGAEITNQGVCWSTSPGPTTDDGLTSEDTGSRTFRSTITGLTPGTTYYVRAYAENSAGTGYGNEVNFTTTAAGVPTLTTGPVSDITRTTAVSGGNVTGDGGADVTARGVCWSTSPNPTTADTTTSDGSGSGTFTSSISGLSAGTTYYIRAYAVNSVGTSYGSEKSFSTPAALPVVKTAAVSEINPTTALCGGNVTDDGGAPVTSRGVCWNTSAAPTTAGNHTVDGSGIGPFTSSITGLSTTATYHVRAYAVNSQGTSYGKNKTFTTPGNASISGTVIDNGTGLAGVTLTFSNGGGTVVTGGDGNYTHMVPFGWFGSVTPGKDGYTFLPGSRAYDNVISDLTNQDFSVTHFSPVISGRVETSTNDGIAGVSGVTLSFLSDGGEEVTVVTDGRGDYGHTVAYGWSGTVTPRKTGYRFAPSSLPYSDVVSSIRRDYTASGSIAGVVSISGEAKTVSGTGIGGVVLKFSDDSGTTYTFTGKLGRYAHTVEQGWTGTVTPSKSGYEFIPPDFFYEPVHSPLTGRDYTGLDFFLEISGRIVDNEGIGVSDVEITASSSLGPVGGISPVKNATTTYTDFNGSYSLGVPHDWSGEVEIARYRYEADFSIRPYENLSTDLAGQDFILTPLEPFITGRITDESGVGLPGVKLVLPDGSIIYTDAGGNYKFPVEPGWSGTVTPTKAGYTFSPPSQSYTGVTTSREAGDYTDRSSLPRVSGKVTASGGTGVPGVSIEFSGDGGTVYTYTDSKGNYRHVVEYGWSGVVTPSKVNHRFDPPERLYNYVDSDLRGRDYTAAGVPVFIMGNVRAPGGVGVPDVVLSFSPGGGSAVTGTDGSYIHPLPYTWVGWVTLSAGGYGFSPPGREYTGFFADAEYQDYTAVETLPVISGRVTVSTGSGIYGLPGVTMIFSGSGGGVETAITDAGGYYCHSVSKGWSGMLVPQMGGYTFIPSSQQFTDVISDRPLHHFTAVFLNSEY